eukprot:Rhum_TRINITY_DN23143_c0_g1::Rhum_TRINITY_DN23143_c0_g1_i1::g.177125::m.177125
MTKSNGAAAGSGGAGGEFLSKFSHNDVDGAGCHIRRKLSDGSFTSGQSARSGFRGRPKISMVTLIVLVFYGVSGGPFGIEAAVGAGGSLLTLVSFLVLPVVWAVPEALVTAELSTTFPEAAGFVAWVESAFGPFWGFMEGYMSWVSGVTDNSVYPVLLFQYVAAYEPSFGQPHIRLPAMYVMVAVLVYLNYRGLEVVGQTSLIVCLFSLSPFVILIALGSFSMSFDRVLLPPTGGWGAVDFPTFLNLMFWNFNYWDSAAVFAGEVGDAGSTFPKAMAIAVVCVVVAYAVPIMVGVAATRDPMSSWTDGHFSVVGQQLGGHWLACWIIAAAAASNIGMFVAELSSDSFQVMGMSERGMLPSFFMRRSKQGTPTAALGLSAVGIAFLVTYDFHEIVEMLNFLYCIAELLEFSAFIKLRVSRPDLHRPFRIPLGTFGCVMLLLPGTLLIFALMYLASWKTWIACGCTTLTGMFLYGFLGVTKWLGVLHFADSPHEVVEATDSETEKTPLLAATRQPTHLVHHAFDTPSEMTLSAPHDMVTGKRGRSPVVGHAPHSRHHSPATSLERGGSTDLRLASELSHGDHSPI